MADNKNKGIKSGSSGKSAIRAFRDPRAGGTYSGSGIRGERSIKSERSADEENKTVKPAEVKEAPAEKKAETKKPSPSIRNAVESKSNAKAKGTAGKKNSWRKASAVYSKSDAEHEAKKAKKAANSKTRRALISVLLILVTAAACIGIYYLSLVKTISISECTRYTKNDILNAAGITSGKCILSYNPKEIKSRLEEDPYLEVLSVKRIIPDEISIEVDEREEYAAIVTGNDSYCVIDKNGYILFTGKREGVGELKSIHGLGTMGFSTGTYINADKSKLRPYVLMELIEAFGKRDGEIGSIDITIPASLKLTTRDGYTIMLGDSVDIESKVERMFAALDKARESGSPNKVIYINSSGSTDIGSGTGAPNVSPTAAPTAPVEQTEVTETTQDPEATPDPDASADPDATDAAASEQP